MHTTHIPVTRSLFDDDCYTYEKKLRDSFEAWVRSRKGNRSGDRCQRELREESMVVYREMWDAFTGFCAQRQLDLQDIVPEDLDAFLMSRGTGNDGTRPLVRTKGDELSLRYARRYLFLIDRITCMQARADGVEANRAAHKLLERPEYRYANAEDKNPVPEYLTTVQVKRLIDHVTQTNDNASGGAPISWKEARNRTAVALMLGAGLSPGDVRAVEVSGIVVDGGRKVGLPWKINVPGNGNSPPRDTPIAEWAGRQLAFWLSVRTQQKIQGDRLFPSASAGTAWSHTGCFESCKAVLHAAGLGDATGGLFMLRHSFALRQLSKGKTEVEVARYLGLLDVNAMRRYRGILVSPADVI
jgi:site-specific recombinase XerD